MGESICDVLVLDKAQGEKVTAALDPVTQKMRDKMREAFQGGQGMSQDERRQAMEKMRAETATETKAALKGVISDDQLKAVEPIIDAPRFRPNLELRALRQLELKAEQRAQLQPIALAYALDMTKLQPARFGEPPAADAQEKTQALNKDLNEKAGKVLTDDQKQAWKTKIEDLQKEMEQMRNQRGGGGGAGGGRRGGQGQ